MLNDCQSLDSREHTVGQDDLAAYIFVTIVVLSGAVPDIDQRGGYVGRVAVVGKANWVGFPIPEQ